MKSQTVKLPAFLASALVNGDETGLTCTCHIGGRDPSDAGQHAKGCDFRWLAEAHAYVAPGHIAGTADQPCDCGTGDDDGAHHHETCASRQPGEAYFSWTCDLPGWGRFGADMLDYLVLYPNEPKPHHDCNQVWAEMADPSCYEFETFEAWHESNCQRD